MDFDGEESKILTITFSNAILMKENTKEEIKMNRQTIKTVGAVHTHTHTHTISLKRKIEKNNIVTLANNVAHFKI